jgi:hypothetical protein
MQKVLVVLCAFLFVTWYFEDELGLVEPEKPVRPVTAKSPQNSGGKPGVVADYDSLPQAKREQVDDAIKKSHGLSETPGF